MLLLLRRPLLWLLLRLLLLLRLRILWLHLLLLLLRCRLLLDWGLLLLPHTAALIATKTTTEIAAAFTAGITGNLCRRIAQ